MPLCLPPRNLVPLLVLCLLFLPVAGFVVRNACGLCRIDIPSWPRAILAVVLVGPVAFFVFDLSGYAVAMIASETPFHELPYKLWLRAPWDWKWQAMNRVPVLQLLPIVFSLCIAGILQVFIFHVPFRLGLLVFMVQWAANLLAFAALAFVCNVGFALLGVPTQPMRMPLAAKVKQETPTEGEKPKEETPKPEDEKELKDLNPEDFKHPLEGWKLSKEGGPAPSHHLQLPPEMEETTDTGTQEELAQGRRELQAGRESLEPYLEPLKTELAPLTARLPGPVQGFLDGGGWWLFIGVNMVLACFWGRTAFVRAQRLLEHSRRAGGSRSVRAAASESLPAPGEVVPSMFGPAPFLVKGLPAHLKLVVLAPGGRETGEVSQELVGTLLDSVRPGLGDAAERDAPKVEIWERQYSKDGFPTNFFYKFRPPESNSRSRWVLMAGSISSGKEVVHVGLALLTEDPSNVGQVRVVNEQWLDVLAVREVG